MILVADIPKPGPYRLSAPSCVIVAGDRSTVPVSRKVLVGSNGQKFTIQFTDAKGCAVGAPVPSNAGTLEADAPPGGTMFVIKLASAPNVIPAGVSDNTKASVSRQRVPQGTSLR